MAPESTPLPFPTSTSSRSPRSTLRSTATRAFRRGSVERSTSPPARSTSTDDGTRFAFTTYRRWGAGSAGQLSALGEITARLDREQVAYWLFGGWGVDFHAGRITRLHDDVDLAVWLDDVPRIVELLAGSRWAHAPEPDEDGGTGYERDGVRLELTYLLRRPDGRVVTPLRDSEAVWRDGAFGDERRSLEGVSARVVDVAALREGKSSPRDEPGDAAKDGADAEILSAL